MSSELPVYSYEDGPWPEPLTSDERTWAMLTHLSALLAIWFGGFAFIGPLICWLIRRDSSRFIDAHGKAALNYQLNLFLYGVITGVVGVVSCGIGLLIAVPILIVLVLLSFILPIFAGVKASNGEMYHYPLTFPLIR